MSSDAVRPWIATAAPLVLLLFGIGFLGANLKLIFQLIQFRLRKRSALLIWDAAKPRYYAFNLALGVACGILITAEVVLLDRPLSRLFGEGMMFVYYGYAFPLSTRIARGFYRDGVWSDRGFLRWGAIAAVSWREEEGGVSLILISRARNIARRLAVPGRLYGQARRVLLDRLKAHDIHFGGAGLDLGSREGSDGI